MECVDMVCMDLFFNSQMEGRHSSSHHPHSEHHKCDSENRQNYGPYSE